MRYTGVGRAGADESCTDARDMMMGCGGGVCGGGGGGGGYGGMAGESGEGRLCPSTVLEKPQDYRVT